MNEKTTNNNTEESPKDENSGDKSRKQKDKNKLNKVIIRRLPPTMNEETFIKQIEPIPEHESMYFTASDYSGINSFSRAYITFIYQEDIYIFKEKFDGYVFVDTKGNEYPAVVEFAPFQGIPKSRSRKKDPKANSIEGEQHYLNFLEMLKNEEAELGKGENKFDFNWNKEEKKITSTPLLEYIANKNQEKRDAKKRKNDDRKRQRDEERQRRKNQVAKTVPEPIKEETHEKITPAKPAEPKIESKDEVVYDDGVVIRTVPSRLSERERRKDKDRNEKIQREKDREKVRERENQRKREKERDREKKNEREFRASEKQKEEDRKNEQRKFDSGKEKEMQQKSVEKPSEKPLPKEKAESMPPKREIKKYSERRRENRARLEKEREKETKSSDTSEKSDAQLKPIASEIVPEIPKQSDADNSEKKPDEKQEEYNSGSDKNQESEHPLKENYEDRKTREADERALRRIRNKDRPAIEIYQPKRRLQSQTSVNSTKNDNSKSSDENSATSQKKSERKSSKHEERHKKNSRDEGKKARKEKPNVEKQKSVESSGEPETMQKNQNEVQSAISQSENEDKPEKHSDENVEIQIETKSNDNEVQELSSAQTDGTDELVEHVEKLKIEEAKTDLPESVEVLQKTQETASKHELEEKLEIAAESIEKTNSNSEETSSEIPSVEQCSSNEIKEPLKIEAKTETVDSSEIANESVENAENQEVQISNSEVPLPDSST